MASAHVTPYHKFSGDEEEDTQESNADSAWDSANCISGDIQAEYGLDGEAVRIPRGHGTDRFTVAQDQWEAVYQEAAVYLLEGLYNDKLDSHPNEPAELKAYHFAHSTPFHVLDIVAGVLIMLLALVEAPQSHDFHVPYRVYTSIEIILLLILMFNVFLRVRWIKVKNLRRHPRIVIKIIILILMIIDSFAVLITDSNHVRVIRALRPFIVLDSHYFKGVRRVARQIIQAIPAVLYMVVLILFVMVLFAAFATFIIANGHDDPYLDSFADCFYNLFILMTTANFPDVMMPSYKYQPATALFFIIYVCTMVFILLNLLLAVVFSSFQALEKEKFRRLLIHKRKVVLLMFDLVTRATGEEDGIRFEHFAGVMKYYKPRMSRCDIRCTFILLARGSNQLLSRSQCYGIYEATALKWTPLDSSLNRMRWYSNFTEQLFRVFRVVDDAVQSRLFSFLTYVVLLAGFICMLYIAIDGEYKKDIARNHSLIAVFVALCGVELLLKLLSAGPKQFFKLFWNLFDTLLLALSIAGLAAALKELEVLIFMRSFRLLKLFQLRKRYRDVMSTIVGLVPQMGNVVLVIILLYYFFAIIGIEALSNKVFPGCCQSAEYMVANYYARGNFSNETVFYYLNSFDSISSSYVTLFELMVINNWWVTMNGFVSETSEWVRIFFLLYYFLSLMVLNILVSFVLDAFVFHLAVSPDNQPSEELTSSSRGSKYYHTVKVKVGYDQISDDLSQSALFSFPAEGYLLFRGQRRLSRYDFSVKMHSAEVQSWLEVLEGEFRLVEQDLRSFGRHTWRGRRAPTLRADIKRNLLTVRHYVESLVNTPAQVDDRDFGYLVINLDDVPAEDHEDEESLSASGSVSP